LAALGDTLAPSAVSAPAPERLQFSGRLSLRVQQTLTGAADGGTVLFEFDGHPQEGTLLLQSVIGTTVATAHWNPQGAEIITPQGTRSGSNLNEVATFLLGQHLPLEALLHWIRAEPWAKANHELRPEGFEQLGWTISLEAWHERMITARRPARADRPQDWDITVRARLDEPALLQQRSRP
jgi:outer membrane lipoprotein LolB